MLGREEHRTLEQTQATARGLAAREKSTVRLGRCKQMGWLPERKEHRTLEQDTNEFNDSIHINSFTQSLCPCHCRTCTPPYSSEGVPIVKSLSTWIRTGGLPFVLQCCDTIYAAGTVRATDTREACC
jgi:hypothetical protein